MVGGYSVCFQNWIQDQPTTTITTIEVIVHCQCDGWLFVQTLIVFSFCYYCWYCVHSKTWTKSIYPLITRWLSNHAFANASLSLDTIDQPQEWMDESLEKLDLTTTKNKWLDFQTQFIFFIACCFVFCST